MAATEITPVPELGDPYSAAAAAANLTWYDLTSGDGYSFKVTGREYLIFRSVLGTGIATISSTADPKYGRTGDVTIDLTAGANTYHAYGPAQIAGFADGSGLIVCADSAGDPEMAIFRVPAGT